MAFEIATAASGRPWPRIYGPCHERNGKTQKKHSRGRTEIHRDQAIVKRYNCTLAKRLLGHQYAVEMLLPEGQRYSEWVARLTALASALSGEVTRVTGKKPVAVIKVKAVYSKPSTPYDRPVGVREKMAPHRASTAAQIFPQDAFTRCVLQGRTPFQSVDQLAIPSVPKILNTSASNACSEF